MPLRILVGTTIRQGGKTNGAAIPLRYLHRPEHDLGQDGGALAALRAPGLRKRMALRPPRPAEPADRPVLRGVVAARRAGGADGEDPRRHPRHLQHVPLPADRGQDGGNGRPHLERPARDRAGRRLVRARARDVRDPVPGDQGAGQPLYGSGPGRRPDDARGHELVRGRVLPAARRAIAAGERAKAATATCAWSVRAADAEDSRPIRGHVERLWHARGDARAQPDARRLLPRDRARPRHARPLTLLLGAEGRPGPVDVEGRLLQRARAVCRGGRQPVHPRPAGRRPDRPAGLGGG